MEHKNLLYFESYTDLDDAYPDELVDSPVPGVAYAPGNTPGDYDVLFNRNVTRYNVTVHHQDSGGTTLTGDTLVTTPLVLDGDSVRVKIAPVSIPNWEAKPVIITAQQDRTYTLVYTSTSTSTVPPTA